MKKQDTRDRVRLIWAEYKNQHHGLQCTPGKPTYYRLCLPEWLNHENLHGLINPGLRLHHSHCLRSAEYEEGFQERPQRHGFLYSCHHGLCRYTDDLWISPDFGDQHPPLWAPALALCALIYVLSMLMFSRSASKLNSWNMFSKSPLSSHCTNRLYAVCHAPYRSGRSRHAAPLCVIHKIALRSSRAFRRGRPLLCDSSFSK